jgi:hypothetical protein
VIDVIEVTDDSLENASAPIPVTPSAITTVPEHPTPLVTTPLFIV